MWLAPLDHHRWHLRCQQYGLHGTKRHWSARINTCLLSQLSPSPTRQAFQHLKQGEKNRQPKILSSSQLGASSPPTVFLYLYQVRPNIFGTDELLSHTVLDNLAKLNIRELSLMGRQKGESGSLQKEEVFKGTGSSLNSVSSHFGPHTLLPP